MHSNTLGRVIGLVCGAALLATAVAHGATAADWDQPTAEQKGNVQFLEGPDGSITVKFLNNSALSPRVATVVADFGETGTADYSGMKKIAFRFVGDGHLPRGGKAYLLLKASNGRCWSYPFDVSPVDGDVVVVEASLVGSETDQPAGWRWASVSGLGSAWASDLENVAYIGVSVEQGGVEEQNYGISGFSLFDSEGVSISASLTAFQQALWNQFRVQNAAAVQNGDEDSDGDGASNLEEAVAGTEANNPNSVFVAEVVSVTESGATVTWPYAEDAVYTLRRSSELESEGGGFTHVVTLQSADAQVVNGNVVYLDGDATEGPYFYKVNVNRE